MIIDELNMFQFHYGTIGSFRAYNNFVNKICFNSTMVRLVDIFKKKAGGTLLFQFHYGTIGRWVFINLHGLLICVSIPLWYDW